MVKPKIRRARRMRKDPYKKYRCPICKKRVNKLHSCNGKTKEEKRKGQNNTLENIIMKKIKTTKKDYTDELKEDSEEEETYE